jgi:alpha-beta hydrolase superfamily lysophospholipase
VKRTVLLLPLLAAFLIAPQAARAQDATCGAQQTFQIPLRGGVATAANTVNVWRRCGSYGWGPTVLAVHGLGHTGQSFALLAEQLLGRGEVARRVSAVVAINMPGRGGSSLAPGSPLALGDLTLADEVSVLLGALARLRGVGLAPHALVAHSMGGLVAALAQDRLVAAGSSLTDAFGLRNVVLVAPVIPLPAGWPLADSGEAARLAAPFARQDPALGMLIDLTPQAILSLFFEDLRGNLTPHAPTSEALVAQGYIAPEAFTAAAQAVRIPDTAPPSVSPGIFHPRHHTPLTLISAGQDFLFTREDHAAAYRYLTNQNGNDNRGGFLTLQDPAAVHDFYISDPALLTNALPSLTE